MKEIGNIRGSDTSRVKTSEMGKPLQRVYAGMAELERRLYFNIRRQESDDLFYKNSVVFFIKVFD